MPRKNLARRFDPRGGVSQIVLDEEARHLAQELEDYTMLSTMNLNQMLDERRGKLDILQQELQPLIDGLAERTQLAVLSVLYRDFAHMAALYLAYLRPKDDDPAPGHAATLATKPAPAPVPFREWLFGPS